jgi:VIT1/CCC1 family predicted Fe2+/Mn2+ transporter
MAGLVRRVARALLGLASCWPMLMGVAAQGSGAASTLQGLQGEIAAAVGAAGATLRHGRGPPSRAR